MAYTFAPRGLQLTSSFSNATPSGQIDNYFIPSGYPTNIASGDLVAVNIATGTLTSMNAAANGAGQSYQTAAGVASLAIGVFQGCTFGLPYNNAQVFPGNVAMSPIPNTGTTYWPGGTRTADDMPALAQVMIDPNMVYNIQASGDASTNLAAVRAERPVPAGTFIPFNIYAVRFNCPQSQANAVPAALGNVGSTFQGLSIMSATYSINNNAIVGALNLYMLRYSPNKELNTGEWRVVNGVYCPSDPYPIIEVTLNRSQMLIQGEALRDTNEDTKKEVAEIKKALNLMMKDQLKKEGK